MTRRLLPLLLALGAFGCAEPVPVGAGESCFRATDCQPGLVCLAATCTADLSGIEGGVVPFPMDAGDVDVDAGPPVDAGPRPDTGPPPADSGPPPVDAGPPPPVDAGPPPPVDAGPPPPVDAGPPPPVDAGPPPPVDAGPPPPVDAGLDASTATDGG